MPLIQAIGTGIGLAGKGIKSVINRAREKRAAKKAEKAAAKASQAEAQLGAMLQKKVSLPAVQGVSAQNEGVMSAKIADVKQPVGIGKNILLPIIGGIVVLLLLFKRK